MSQKEKNRKNMPLCTAFIDLMREEFPYLTVTYAKEGGLELGTKPEPGCSDFIIGEYLEKPKKTR